MDELIPYPLPESQEISYPEPDWHRRFFNVFDWFRAQTWYVRATAVQQWAQAGKAHLLEPLASDVNNRCETWYSEQGKFFIRLWVKDGVIQENMICFQGESVLKMYGHEVVRSAKRLGAFGGDKGN